MADEQLPIVAVDIVKFVANFSLPMFGLFEQLQCPGLLSENRVQQTADFKQTVKFAELLVVLQTFEVKLFASQRRFVSMVQGRRDKVADDVPGIVRQGVEVIPALLNRGASVEFVAIVIGIGVFQLNEGHHFGEVFRFEVSQGTFGNSHILDCLVSLQ